MSLEQISASAISHPSASVAPGRTRFAPSVVIVPTTLLVSVLGGWLHDRLDPTLR